MMESVRGYSLAPTGRRHLRSSIIRGTVRGLIQRNAARNGPDLIVAFIKQLLARSPIALCMFRCSYRPGKAGNTIRHRSHLADHLHQFAVFGFEFRGFCQAQQRALLDISGTRPWPGPAVNTPEAQAGERVIRLRLAATMGGGRAGQHALDSAGRRLGAEHALGASNGGDFRSMTSGTTLAVARQHHIQHLETNRSFASDVDLAQRD
ncbi:hypothetical protein [Cupriavidus basilensis]|uniref:hypothetical protein n=1 Tax=Cupriavidus basilensis TaxID=68895 RepID=UPI0005BAA721|nr:hypothetical protein [Cupriavidus basilensis]